MKSEKIKVLNSLDATRVKMPKYNGFTGYGIHGDTKYNRNKENRNWKKRLREEW